MAAENSSMSVSAVLTIVFVVLKLTDYIDWSWIWVLSPIWIPIVLWIIVLGVLKLFFKG
jgi:hypothetical protein